MAFVWWFLFIISFFSTIFVIIMKTIVLEKDKYKKRKHFFIALIIGNIVSFGVCLSILMVPGGVGGLALVALYFLFTIFVLIPLAFIDIASILIFLRKQCSQDISRNKSSIFQVGYAVLVISVILIIVIAWPVLKFYFSLIFS